MLAECRLIVPEYTGDGHLVPLSVFRLLERDLVKLAGGLTMMPGPTYGVWRNPRAELVYDSSRVYLVALPADKVESLRQLAVTWGQRLRQESVYLAVAGWVELVPIPAEVYSRTLATSEPVSVP
jgi:hypothetical protein